MNKLKPIKLVMDITWNQLSYKNLKTIEIAHVVALSPEGRANTTQICDRVCFSTFRADYCIERAEMWGLIKTVDRAYLMDEEIEYQVVEGVDTRALLYLANELRESGYYTERTTLRDAHIAVSTLTNLGIIKKQEEDVLRIEINEAYYSKRLGTKQFKLIKIMTIDQLIESAKGICKEELTPVRELKLRDMAKYMSESEVLSFEDEIYRDPSWALEQVDQYQR